MPDAPTPTAPAAETVAADDHGLIPSPFRPVNDTNDLLNTTDAAVWAATFAKILREKGYKNDDWEGWLVGWFANAMGAMEMALYAQGRLVDSRIPIPDGWDPDVVLADAKDLLDLLVALAGGASMCWEYMEFVGRFKEEQAIALVNAVMERLNQRYEITEVGQ